MSRPDALRAPDEDGGLLCSPSLEELDGSIDAEQTTFRTLAAPLQAIREQARQEVIAAARSYLQHAGEPLPQYGGDRLILTGHQPELFHPGVWLKYFATEKLARRWQSRSLSFIVDHDAVKSSSLQAPALQPQPHKVEVPLDVVPPGMPYEEWHVGNESKFAGLPDRLNQGGGQAWSLLPVYWRQVLQQSARTQSVPERLSAARRVLERAWGYHNLETTMSSLCQTESFARFAVHLLQSLPRFLEIFSEALKSYRRLHHLRSKTHPFPDLAQDGNWLEAPFWVWRTGATARSRLFVRREESGLALRLGHESAPVLGGDMVRAWQTLEAEGIKVRCRALTTTLFTRLFVADLFVHGLGGGKYDAVTDEVIRRFYGVTPPPFAVVTGTLRLPLPAYATTPDDIRRQKHLLRDHDFNPQRYLSENEQNTPLLRERQAWVESEPVDRAGRRRRNQTLRRLNRELSDLLLASRDDIERKLERAKIEAALNATVLRRRDWAFCLYPEDGLRKFLLSFKA